MSKLHYLPLLFVITSICLSSCEGNNSGPSTTTTGDATFILDPEEGGSQMLALEFANSWEVTESPSWCTVSPASGEAGQVEMTVSASSANENLMEREGTFKIRLASSEEVEYWVVQRGTEGISVLRQDAYALDTGEDVTFRIEGNVPVTAESISTDAEWLTVKSVETSDSVLLGDGRTNSEYYTGEIVLSVENNTGAGQRSGAVTIDGQEVTVHQTAAFDGWDNTFYRRSTVQRFTATWCGFCPAMGEAYKEAEKALPGRFVPINMHPLSSDGSLSWDGTDHFDKLYGIYESYPVSIINGIAKVSNQYVIATTTKMMTLLAEEAVSDFPSQTNIMAFSSISEADRTVHVDAFVAMKDQKDYRITVLLLEDSIIASQLDGTGILTDSEMENYVHEHIARAALTDLDGDIISGSGERTVAHISLESAIPQSVISRKHLSIAIYVSYAGSPDKSLCDVSGITYLDTGYFIDNAVALPANGSTEYLFE